MVLNLMKNICYKLLETAKRVVEIGIEEDEEAAIRYIEQAQRASIWIAMGETRGNEMECEPNPERGWITK